MADNNNNWHSMDVKDVMAKLNTSKNGLSKEEAQIRLEQYGYNKLPEPKKTNLFMRFIIHFHNALIYVLLAAAVITALMDHWIDTWVILAVVIINAIIGFVQEGKAEKALENIKHMLSLKSALYRNGKREEIDAENIVPGDIVILSSGDKIPADLRILEASNLKVEESTLTGESTAVTKKPDPVDNDAVLGDRLSMAYSGTTVRNGSATGVIVATGTDTELGKINEMISKAEDITTPLIKQMNTFAKWLSFIIIGISLLFFVFGYTMRDYAIDELFLITIGLSVAAIPEGLPAILTVTLAIGVQRMAKRNAIIRRLPSVETLGSVSVICSDKTGTLTKNEMTAKTIVTSENQYEVQGSGYAPDGKIKKDNSSVDIDKHPVLSKLLQTMWLCNNSEIKKNGEGQWDVAGYPTEGALVTLGYKAGLKNLKSKRLSSIPFDSEYKYMATLDELDGKRYIFLKGAPERLLDLCQKQLNSDKETKINPEMWTEKMNQIAQRGQRMIGAAFCSVDDKKDTLSHEDIKKNMVFLGVVGIIDPPRPEAIDAITECKEAGIRVKMITGDHAVTANAIGKEMGICDGQKAVTGVELENMSDEKMKESVEEHDVFARTSPEHKLRLVKALQANNKICAMTGDGVNDAPALKQANVGIAMGIKGTEVTKDSASMVLADDNFASIVNAVEEGRTIYDNLKKAILFILPTNGAEALVLIMGLLLGITIPITPVQILWINMVTAVTLALALSFEPMESKTMKLPPRNPDESILNSYFLWRIIFVSLLIGGLVFTIFMHLRDGDYPVEMMQTVLVNSLVAGQLFYLFNCRKIHEPALGKGFFDNKIVFIVSFILIFLQLVFTYVPFMNGTFGTYPISLKYWAFPLITGVIVFLAVELEKFIVLKLSK
ncbi:cation-transporting P-type ATPase [Herbivorax sp. ANBcel31]|uniref:cation-transporting P-type ATPase n=1 Tax=Herbivorax sp. ANBcel31 TaxID=3069754 RepID=UPI0027B26C89|nr:cation-transporting P-type ATPase [Herbivorax sp. ANBcel31]MDQ2086151.1 cation-transporting P-type ATPase [Herbivorax sp. ANBcel31]